MPKPTIRTNSEISSKHTHTHTHTHTHRQESRFWCRTFIPSTLLRYPSCGLGCWEDAWRLRTNPCQYGQRADRVAEQSPIFGFQVESPGQTRDDPPFWFKDTTCRQRWLAIHGSSLRAGAPSSASAKTASKEHSDLRLPRVLEFQSQAQLPSIS